VFRLLLCSWRHIGKTLKDPTTSGLRVDQYPTAIISGFTPQKIGDGPPNEYLLVKPASDVGDVMLVYYNFASKCSLKAKFHYASWFEAGRQPASNQLA